MCDVLGAGDRRYIFVFKPLFWVLLKLIKKIYTSKYRWEPITASQLMMSKRLSTGSSAFNTVFCSPTPSTSSCQLPTPGPSKSESASSLHWQSLWFNWDKLWTARLRTRSSELWPLLASRISATSTCTTHWDPSPTSRSLTNGFTLPWIRCPCPRSAWPACSCTHTGPPPASPSPSWTCTGPTPSTRPSTQSSLQRSSKRPPPPSSMLSSSERQDRLQRIQSSESGCSRPDHSVLYSLKLED